MHKLNLGRFTDCVEYLTHEQLAEYGVDSNTKILYHSSNHDRVLRIIGQSDRSSVTIGTSEVGVATPDGTVDDPKTIANLMALIELKIMGIINQLIESNDYLFQLGDIRIPVKKIQFFNDDKGGGCYGWAEIGVGYFHTPKEAGDRKNRKCDDCGKRCECTWIVNSEDEYGMWLCDDCLYERDLIFEE